MIFYIAKKSLMNRKLTSFLCLFSITLSVALFLGVEKVKDGAENGFTNTISKTDLIVGSKAGPVQLLLYTVFHLGSPTNNITMESYNKIKANPLVKWTIPISLGDSYRGHRVVATDENYYKHYRYQGDKKVELKEGRIPTEIWDVTIGSEIAKKFGFNLGDPIQLSHGISKESIYEHIKSPFKVQGILKPTSTPIDKAIYINLYGMEAMHKGWETGVPDTDMADKSNLKKEDLETKQITAFLLAAKNRIFTLRLRSMIDNFQDEALMAVIPGMALAELWNTIGYVEKALALVSLCVLIVGLLGIVISLYTSINERRREMAILRSLGASGAQVLTLLITEAFVLVTAGCLLGLGLLYGGMFILSPYLASEFSVYLPIEAPSLTEIYYLAGISFGSLIIGMIPGLKAYKNSLSDGLTIKV